MTRIDLGNLPVWSGVQSAPGIRALLPFSFELDQGLMRLGVAPAVKDEIVRSYSADSYSFITTPPGASTWGNRLGNVQFGYLSRMLGDLSGKTILEIGAGSLYLGARVVDAFAPSRYVACDPVLVGETAPKPIEVFAGYFGAEAFAGESFDVVMSINNLEHVPDPVSYLMAVRELLVGTNGAFFVMVPDCTNGFRSGDWGICLHEHLTYFTTYSFVKTVSALGFQVKQLVVDEDEIVALLIPAVPEGKIGDLSELPALDQRRQRFNDSLVAASQVIARAKAGKGPVGIHGCSVAVNNFLSRLGLENDPDLFLFDGDEAKIAKYMPSFHRAILATSSPEYGDMSHMIVGVSTYFESIKRYAQGIGYAERQLSSLMPIP